MQRTRALMRRPVVRDVADGPRADGAGALRHPAKGRLPLLRRPETRTAGGYGDELLAGHGSIVTGMDDVSYMLQMHDRRPPTVPCYPRLTGECG